MTQKPLHFNAFVMNTNSHIHHGQWRREDARQTEFTNVNTWINLAKLLEDAKFDAMFFADVVGHYGDADADYSVYLEEGLQIQIPLSLPDADAAVIYQFAADLAGLDRDSALADDADLIHEQEFLPYQSVFAARAEDVDDPTWAIFEEIYHSDEMIDVFEVEYQGARVHSQSSREEIQDLQHEIQDSLKEASNK